MEVTPELKLVVFRIQKTFFGVDVSQVVEVTQPDNITVIPKAPPTVAGVTDFRGQIIPVINLAARLNLESGLKENWYVIVTNALGSPIGVQVDYVESVLSVPKDSVNPSSSIAGINLQEVDFLKGIVPSDLGLILLIDFEKLLSKEEIVDLSKMAGKITSTKGATKTSAMDMGESEELAVDLSKLTRDELVKFAKELGIPVKQNMKKDDLVKAIEKAMGA